MGVDEKDVNCTEVSFSGTYHQRALPIIPLSGDTPMYIGVVHQALAQLDTDSQLARQG
jgi:hypothetical protein